jgi:hypothetical protein
MRKFIYLALGIFLMTPSIYSQTVQKWTEDFDGNVTFSAIPTGSWSSNALYYLQDSSVNNPKSYLGLVPTNPGDSTILQTPVYDCTNYDYIILRFSHICKVSPNDIVGIEYRVDAGAGMGHWSTLPATIYKGKASVYTGGFNALSYQEWQADDSTLFPQQYWWKEEIFDLGGTVNQSYVQFRFVIKHGLYQGTQISYGWLLDNFQLLAASQPIPPPVVEFISPLVWGTLYSVGPWEINAKVRTSTASPIQTPWLKYTTIQNGTPVKTDSVVMTAVSGDSLWKATVPPFVAGTEVCYSITGEDAAGNQAKALSGYVIGLGGSESFVLQDGSASYGDVPFNYSGYSRSMSLYPAAEMSKKTGGLITSLALRVDLSPRGISREPAQGGAFPIRVWLKTVPASKTTWNATDDNLEWAVLTQNATLVYDGIFHFAKEGWFDIPLDTGFLYNGTDNLVVMFEENCGGSNCNMYMLTFSYYFYSTTQTDRFWMKSQGATPPTISTGLTISANRPDLRINIINIGGTDAASVHAIGVNDTVFVSPGVNIPVVALIKNKGTTDLSSVNVSYSVNGSATVTKNLPVAPAIAWDFIVNDTLGYYTSKVNDYDTVTIWIDSPNGQQDIISWDDTLTKIIYGSSDINMRFVNCPADTVNSTGPFEIRAEIITFSGALVGQTPLIVASTFENITTYDTLQMVNTSGNLWTATIPHKAFGTKVTYAIKLTDIVSNQPVLENSYYIERKFGENAGYVTAGTGRTYNANTSPPIFASYAYNWNRMLYLGKEFSPDVTTGGLITKLAWDNASSTVESFINQSCYFQAVDDTLISNLYIDPVANGATLVWEGTYNVSAIGWTEITLDKPFVLPQGKNLLIYWYNRQGTAKTTHPWISTLMPANYTVYDMNNTALRTSTLSTYATYTVRPNVRLYMDEAQDLNNSAAIAAINSPENAKGVFASSPVPVQVTIRNEGMENLNNCIINWTLNGNLQTPATYNGDLPEDFTDTITIGSYMATVGKWDTVTVWVSAPNGDVDLTLYDDTLTVMALGCAPFLSGDVAIGSGETFTTINEVLDIIRGCGVAGDITLKLNGVFDENVDLTNLSDYMDGHHITITSANNDANNAIIRPPSGVGIMLSKMRNLTLKAITVDAATSGTHAIHFIQVTGSCTNIVIRDCKLLADPTTSASTKNVIHKSDYGIVDSIFVINNIMDGGYYGSIFYGGSSQEYGKNIVFDSNTISNNHTMGLSLRYGNFHCFHNTFLSRTSNTQNYWYGLVLSNSNGSIVGNRIVQRTTAITSPIGINVEASNANHMVALQSRSLIANNEIILSTSTEYYGIYATASKSEIVHNSIYISGSGAAKGIYIRNVGNNDMVIKNNNIVLSSPSAHPVFIHQAGFPTLYDFDYNNLYAPTYTGYYGANVASMADWQQIFPNDTHSVSVLPDFIAPSNHLKYITPVGLFCDRLASTNNDIEGKTRTNPTTMGCYEIAPKNVNAMLSEMTQLQEGHVFTQTDTVKVTLYNAGSASLTSVNLEWSINGVSQTAGGVNYPVSLNTGQSTVITLGNITYPARNVNVKAWINTVNGSASIDEDHSDDTLSASAFVCAGNYNGRFTIGTSASSDFQTIEQFFDALDFCGINGDITLALEPGLYAHMLDFSNNSARMSNYALTITSTTNNADAVIIRPPSGSGVLLSNTRNLTLKAITVDAATSGTFAIEFTDACTNIVVRDCKLLADPNATTRYYNVVQKVSTGAVDSVFFINNLLDGGYTGFNFYAGYGNGDLIGTHVLFDSNIVSNSYNSGIYLFDADLISCSYNTLLSKTSSASTSWLGFIAFYNNGPIIGNRIIERSMFASSAGLCFYYHNLLEPNRALIANNEIIIQGSNYGTGMETDNDSKADILHNSIYVAGSGNLTKGIYIGNQPNNDIVIKNNNIVLEETLGGHPIYFSQMGNLNRYDIDYNNLYAPSHIGYYGGDVSTMTEWQQTITTDQHSVRTLPNFTNSLSSLEISTYNDSLLCPAITNVQNDINENIRPKMTTMGAYRQPAIGRDMALMRISPWDNGIVNNQIVQVNVDVLNTGVVPLTGATLEWSVNGTSQNPISWTASPQLNSFEQTNVSIGTFQAINADTFNILVWINTINGQADTVHWNDTLSATAVIIPLAEFIAPLEDTLYVLNFDVEAKIHTATGAPLTPPQLCLKTTVNNSLIDDTIAMVLNNGIWQANIPQQYYNGKVIYSLTVSDTTGNILTAIDSVYIKFLTFGGDAEITIGEGAIGFEITPIGMYDNYNWSRQIYLYREVCPELSPTGLYITKIAWQLRGGNTGYNNQTCYMRATTDSVEVTRYTEPLASGASQVWAGSLPIVYTGYPGWIEITLDVPYFLPAGKNLEIIWFHQGGSNSGSPWNQWAHTQVIDLMTVYARGFSSFPVTAGTLSAYRPNILITREAPFYAYSGENLALSAFLSPESDNLCSPNYTPVTVQMRNLGDVDYDFSTDSIALHLEVTDPLQTKYTAYVQIQTGTLASGEATTVTLLSSLPTMYAGQYDMKAWLESPIDNIVYDDTVYYSYRSGRIRLPIDEDFSNAILPAQFIATPIVGSEVWTPYSDPTSPVQPDFGTGVLRYVGARGTMTHLTIRQPDLSGVVNPRLEFWYYHDSTAPGLDNSYTDVNIIVDGVPITVLSILRKDTAHGWKQYTVDLNPYIISDCMLVRFITMNKYGSESVQYIDRISITSSLDLEVSEIIISPEISACNLTNKAISVVLSSNTNHAIDFSNYNSNLALEVPGYPTFTVPLQNVVSGNSSDTVFIVGNINIASGINTVKACLTSPVDDYPLNDTISLVLDVRPALSVTVNPVTDVNNRINMGTKVWQEAIIENTGTVSLSGIELLLRITGTNQDIVRETLPVDLEVGETYTYQFVNPYIVPADERYQVSLIAYLGCDSANVNTGDAIDEYVDMHNLSIISIDNPPMGQPDTVGATVNITVSLANADDINSFENVSIYAVIETEEGQQITRLGTIEEILPLDTLQFTFGESYTVPEDSVYRIRVYLGKGDNYPEDDTTETIRRTVSGDVSIKEVDGSNIFTLGQNIPNPANNRTRIDYSIPESGKVVFHVHSISGQLLYSKTIEAVHGKQSLELNTNTFAAGIYFYSIEYKGQRLVKRMMISD